MPNYLSRLRDGMCYEQGSSVHCFDGRYPTDILFKGNFVVMFPNNGKHLSFNSHYFKQTLINQSPLAYI
jgi:hypothetical protein